MIASGTKHELKGILRSEETIVIQVDRMSHHLEETLSHHPSVSSVVIEDSSYKVVTMQSDLFDEIIAMAAEARVKLLSIQVKPPTLEDVFLHLTGRKLRD